MSKEFSRYGLRWAFPLLGLCAWLSLGCNPQSLSFMLNGFSGDKVDPTYKLFTGKDEVTLVLLTHFDPPELRTEVVPVETELADKLEKYIRVRCQENKHKVKIVAAAKVRSYVMKQRAEGDFSPTDVGRHFKADYVIDLSIQSCDLYEKLMRPPAYNGKATIAVSLYKMNAKDENPKVFSEDYNAYYPGKDRPVEASARPEAEFRGIFMNILARDISKMFIAFPQQERHVID